MERTWSRVTRRGQRLTVWGSPGDVTLSTSCPLLPAPLFSLHLHETPAGERGRADIKEKESTARPLCIPSQVFLWRWPADEPPGENNGGGDDCFLKWLGGLLPFLLLCPAQPLLRKLSSPLSTLFILESWARGGRVNLFFDMERPPRALRLWDEDGWTCSLRSTRSPFQARVS